MKMIKLARAVPSQYVPNRNTPYVYTRRIIDVTSRSPRTGRRSNKEYITRVYHYSNGSYGIIAFYGTINSTLKQDWKGSSTSRRVAINAAETIIDIRVSDRAKNYENAPNINSFQVPGVMDGSASSSSVPQPRQQPRQPSSSTPPAPRTTTTTTTTLAPITMSRFESLLVAMQAVEAENMDQRFNNEIMGHIANVDVDSIDLIKRYPLAELYVHDMLNGEHRDRILELSKEFFDKIRMSPEDRGIVESHFSSNPKGEVEEELVEEEVEEEGELEIDFRDLLSGDEVNRILTASEDLYMDISNAISNDLAGYFKYSIVSDKNEEAPYSIWWKGLGDNIEITNHNMPQDLFEEHYAKIKTASQWKAEGAYKDVLNSYVGGR